MGQRWETDDMELKGVYESDGSYTTKTWPPHMSIQGNIMRPTLKKIPIKKGFRKYAHKDSYMEKSLNHGKDVNPLLL